MQTSTNSNPKVLWSARVIGWITLFFGIESGFIVASINWFRMGYKAKAFIHVAIAILIACVNAFFLQDYIKASSYLSTSEYTVRLLIRFCLIFLAIAYLHTATRKDIHKLLESGMAIKNWNWFFAVLIGLVLFVSFDFLNKSVSAYQLYSLQNHVYCDTLQPGMTFNEVQNVLDKIGENTLIKADSNINPDEFKAAHEITPTYYWVVFFETNDEKVQTALSGKGFGFDANNKLIWVSTFSGSVIQCSKLP